MTTPALAWRIFRVRGSAPSGAERTSPTAMALAGPPFGREAVRLGVVTAEHPARVLVRTVIGCHRVLERPYGELLPRTCQGFRGAKL